MHSLGVRQFRLVLAEGGIEPLHLAVVWDVGPIAAVWRHDKAALHVDVGTEALCAFDDPARVVAQQDVGRRPAVGKYQAIHRLGQRGERLGVDCAHRHAVRGCHDPLSHVGIVHIVKALDKIARQRDLVGQYRYEAFRCAIADEAMRGRQTPRQHDSTCLCGLVV